MGSDHPHFVMNGQELKKNIPFEIPLLKKNGNNHRITIDANYLNELLNQFHKDCINYLEKWIEPMKELKIWTWAAF